MEATDQEAPRLPPDIMPDILEAWQTDHLPEGFSFAATGPSSPAEMPQWRLDLVTDPQQARRQLDAAGEKIQMATKTLETLPHRLDQFIARVPAGPEGSLSFSAQELAQDLAEPETDLLQLLATVETIKEADRGETSFAVSEETGAWDTINTQFKKVMGHLTKMISHYAWVETQIQQQLLGRTIVDWTGDMNTTWGTGFTPDQLALHRRSLSLAIAARQTQLRTLIIATQGAVKIASLLAMPGGALVALPVAWKYVSQVLAEINHYQAISSLQGV